MKRYECTKSFLIPTYDEDGFYEEDGEFLVEAGSIWLDEGESYRPIGGDIKLDSEDGSKWLELTDYNVKEFFREIEQDELTNIKVKENKNED